MHNEGDIESEPENYEDYAKNHPDDPEVVTWRREEALRIEEEEEEEEEEKKPKKEDKKEEEKSLPHHFFRNILLNWFLIFSFA